MHQDGSAFVPVPWVLKMNWRRTSISSYLFSTAEVFSCWSLIVARSCSWLILKDSYFISWACIHSSISFWYLSLACSNSWMRGNEEHVYFELVATPILDELSSWRTSSTIWRSVLGIWSSGCGPILLNTIFSCNMIKMRVCWWWEKWNNNW